MTSLMSFTARPAVPKRFRRATGGDEVPAKPGKSLREFDETCYTPSTEMSASGI